MAWASKQATTNWLNNPPPLLNGANPDNLARELESLTGWQQNWARQIQMLFISISFIDYFIYRVALDCILLIVVPDRLTCSTIMWDEWNHLMARANRIGIPGKYIVQYILALQLQWMCCLVVASWCNFARARKNDCSLISWSAVIRRLRLPISWLVSEENSNSWSHWDFFSSFLF